ncbi:MAG: hypothetical protein ACR2GR_06320 [Rhodothermales bacterium]
MDRELSKKKVQAQIDAKEREISSQARVLEDEAKYFGFLAKERVDLFKEQAKNNAFAIGGGIVGGGLLLKMLFSGNDSEDTGAYRRTLTEPYVASLAHDVEAYLDEHETLQEALLQALRDRAPLLLENPDVRSGSFWGSLLGLGLLAGAAFGANYASQYLTGQNLIDLVRGQLGDDTYEPSFEATYPPVHGTAGAEMPDPDFSSSVSFPDVAAAMDPLADTPSPARPVTEERPPPPEPR